MYLLVCVLATAPTATAEDLFVVVAGPTTVQLEWLEPRAEDTNGLIRAYVVNITELETGTSWQQRIEDDTDALIESLHPFYSYSLSVAAETVDLGPFTLPTTVEMPEDGIHSFTVYY